MDQISQGPKTSWFDRRVDVSGIFMPPRSRSEEIRTKQPLIV